MNTISSFFNSNIWEKTKRAFYTLQLVAIILAVPVLGFLEMSHSDASQPQQTITHEKSIQGNQGISATKTVASKLA